MADHAPVVAVVGATGAAGSTLLRVLEERSFPHSEMRLLASPRSEGIVVGCFGRRQTVNAIDVARLDGVQIAFFAAGSAIAKEFAPRIAAGGGVAVDKSSAYRADPDVPLIVPEVNAGVIGNHRGIVSNPNCVAIPLTVVLAPLHEKWGIRQVTVATYQAASGGGRDLVTELRAQESSDSRGVSPSASLYPYVLHGNVVPGGWNMIGGDTDEELKIVAETRRVMGLPTLRMSVTTVRVPVTVGHSAAVYLEFEKSPDAEMAQNILGASSGITLVDDPTRQRYPTPRTAAGQDAILVGRVRTDRGRDNGLALFWSADNLRKGAATNAVQVAELLVSP